MSDSIKVIKLDIDEMDELDEMRLLKLELQYN